MTDTSPCISLSTKFRLTDHAVVRRESFGALCCNLKTGQYTQFNPDAFPIFRLLRNSMDIAHLRLRLAQDGWAISEGRLLGFMTTLASNGLLAVGAGGVSKARIIDAQEALLKESTHLVAPSSCTIYITDRCPKQCLHCITRSSPTASIDGEYGTEQWFEVLERLSAWGVITLVITGGEPMIKRDIFRILRRAGELGFSISLLTDFDGFTEEHVRELKSIEGLNYVQTSLDGATEPTHDYLRGPGSFKKTLKRLDLFRRTALPVTISTAVHKGNIDEIDGIAAIYHEYNVQYLYLNPVAPYGRAKQELQHLVLDDVRLKRLGQTYYRLISREGVHSGNAYWQNLTDSEAEAPDFHPFRDCLHAASTGSYVFSIGSRGQCHLDSKLKSEGLLPLGNALKGDFAVMWRDAGLSKLRAGSDFENPTFVNIEEVRRIHTETRLMEGECDVR